MIHTTGNGNNFFISQLIDGSGSRREDSSSKSKRSEVALAEGKQYALLGEDDIMLLATFDLVDLVALKRHHYFVDGQHFFSLVL